jgi:hypothetical protein
MRNVSRTVVAVGAAAVGGAPLPAALSAKSRAQTCMWNKVGCDCGVAAVAEAGTRGCCK